MTLLYALVGIAVVVAVAMLAVGRFGELPDAPPDRAPLDVPDGPLEPDDVDAVRFAVGLRGYRMDEVDVVLDRLSADLAARDARISELEQAVAAPGARATAPGAAETAATQTDPVDVVPQVDPGSLPPPPPDWAEEPVLDPLDRRWQPDPDVPPTP